MCGKPAHIAVFAERHGRVLHALTQSFGVLRPEENALGHDVARAALANAHAPHGIFRKGARMLEHFGRGEFQRFGNKARVVFKAIAHLSGDQINWTAHITGHGGGKDLFSAASDTSAFFQNFKDHRLRAKSIHRTVGNRRIYADFQPVCAGLQQTVQRDFIVYLLHRIIRILSCLQKCAV